MEHNKFSKIRKNKLRDISVTLFMKLMSLELATRPYSVGLVLKDTKPSYAGGSYTVTEEWRRRRHMCTYLEPTYMTTEVSWKISKQHSQ